MITLRRSIFKLSLSLRVERVSENRKKVEKMTDKRFNPKKANLLMSTDRKELLPPDKIIGHLDIRSNDIIADLGAGNGYFSIPMAKKSKAVYAVDIEPKMLDMLKGNAKQEQLENIRYVESDLDEIQLDDDSVNKAMISLVLHEIPDTDKTLDEIKRILKTRGQILVIEWEAVQTESGPPLHHRIASKEMITILERNGFDAEVIPLNPDNYAVKAMVKE